MTEDFCKCTEKHYEYEEQHHINEDGVAVLDSFVCLRCGEKFAPSVLEELADLISTIFHRK